MKRSFLLLLLNSNAVFAIAQTQFWNENIIEAAPWDAARQQQKVKHILAYKTDEQGRRLDSITPDNIHVYNDNGALVSITTYKTDWAKRSRQLQTVDSSIYNEKGQLIRYLRCEGVYREVVFETTYTYDNKGQEIKEEDYTIKNSERTKELTTIAVHNAAGKLISLSTKGTSLAVAYIRRFVYDIKGQLIRTDFHAGGVPLTNTYTWSKDGQLMTYEESEGKEVKKTITYSYDAQGRLQSKETKSSGDYTDKTLYRYSGNNKFPGRTAMEYTGLNGKNDRRREYWEFVYD